MGRRSPFLQTKGKMRTLKEIYDDLRRSIITELQKVNSDVVDTELGLEAPLALAHAAQIRLLEILSNEVSREATPLTAQSRDVSTIGNLEYYGLLVDIIRFPAKQGRYEALFTSTLGGVVPAGTEIKADNNVLSLVLNDIEIPPKSTAIGEIMTKEFGTEFSIPVDMNLTITTGISGVEQKAK